MVKLICSSAVLVIITVHLLLWRPACSARSNQRAVYLSEMRNCPGKEELPIMGVNFTLERDNRTQQYISGSIVMKEAFPNGFKVNLAIKACEDMKDLSTCKPFLSQLATNEICLLLKAPLPSYKALGKMSPPLRCPLQATTYNLNHFIVPNDLARYMQRSDKMIYYFNRISGTKNGREVVCFEFFMYSAAAVKKS